VLTPAIFQQRQDDRFADNEFLRITESSFRALAADMVATFVPLAEANVPAYDPTRFYAQEYLVTFDDLYYRAKVQGFLPAPTPGVETAEWKPDRKPLPSTLPYREITAQQGRDFGRDGLLAPSTLYRFTQRVDASTGDPLDDVLVVALSRHRVAGADAYTIGINPQSREEYLLPVSYELATDTTAPRAAGPSGPVDSFTKAEVAALLAGKLNTQAFTDLLGAAPAALDSIHELAAELLANEAGAAALLLTQQQQGQQIKDLQAASGPDLSSYYTKQQADARYAPARSPFLVLPFAANVNLDFSRSQQRLSLTNNIGFGPAVNKAEGAALELHLYNGAASDVTLSFPSAWTFLGPRPNVLATGSKAVLTLACAWGSAEGDITAGYAAEL
jgi:hypothetical protein